MQFKNHKNGIKTGFQTGKKKKMIIKGPLPQWGSTGNWDCDLSVP